MLSSYGNQLKQIGYLIFKKQLRNIFFTEDICYHVGEGRRARNTKIRVDPKRHWRNFQQDYEGREEIGIPRKMNS